MPSGTRNEPIPCVNCGEPTTKMMYCEKCVKIKANERTIAWRSRNKEKVAETKRQWKKNNPDKVKQYRETFNEKHPEIAKNSWNDWREKNMDHVKEVDKIWKANNKDRTNAASKRSRDKRVQNGKYKELFEQRKLDGRTKEYHDKKYHNDINYKLKILLRGRVNSVIKNNKKADHSLTLLGCTVQELKDHLESKFTDGMTWENYGKFGWHVDHIIPCASFDLSIPENQKICFHYTNLQPMWWRENIVKGKKLQYTYSDGKEIN